MPQLGVTANVIGFNLAISACEKGGQWEQALTVLRKMRETGMTLVVISFGATISVREKEEQ